MESNNEFIGKMVVTLLGTGKKPEELTKRITEAFDMIVIMRTVTDEAMLKAVQKIGESGKTAEPWNDFSTANLIRSLMDEYTEFLKSKEKLISERDDEEVNQEQIDGVQKELLDVINTAIFSYLSLERERKK